MSTVLEFIPALNLTSATPPVALELNTTAYPDGNPLYILPALSLHRSIPPAITPFKGVVEVTAVLVRILKVQVTSPGLAESILLKGAENGASGA
jgi:hypothetical protein